MKTSIDPTTPLLQILKDDSADLPLRAAGEASRTRSLRVKRRRQIAITATLIFCSVGGWSLFPRNKEGHVFVAIQTPSDVPVAAPAHSSLRSSAPSGPPSQNVVILQAVEPLNGDELTPLPEGLTEEQESVVKAASGLPLLLVRDTAGNVVRIHAIER